MDVANFVYEHSRGNVYGYFSEAGLKVLKLPHAERVEKKPYVLHSAKNIVRGELLRQALERYFSGMREEFAEVALDIADATEFQQEVWVAARETRWGVVSTYGALAESIGMRKGASRAVGHALGQNPIALVVPCHRFLSAKGAMQGFAAGLAWKEELLRIEGSLLRD